MKKCISVLAFAALFLVSGKVLQAQFKMAYLYADSLILAMPEAKQADSALQQFAGVYEKAIKAKNDDYLKKTKEAQQLIDANGGAQPSNDPLFQLLLKDITTLEKDINELNQTAQNKLNERRQQLYEPIIKKAKDAIADVAKAKGYTYVLDASIGTVLYSQPGDNIMDAVMKKLGIK